MHNKHVPAHTEARPSKAVVWLWATSLCCPTCAPTASGHQVRLQGLVPVLTPASNSPAEELGKGSLPVAGQFVTWTEACTNLCCCKCTLVHIWMQPARESGSIFNIFSSSVGYLSGFRCQVFLPNSQTVPDLVGITRSSMVSL